MAKDINKRPFDEATKIKLKIFGKCYQEWLPVFNYNSRIEKIFVYDLFAGSGMDIKNEHGSPLILLEKTINFESQLKKDVIFAFNDAQKTKSKKLKENVDTYIKNNYTQDDKSKIKYYIENDTFKNIFSRDTFKKTLSNDRYGKFVILDQYGFSQIDNNIFRDLVSFPKTDFIFFITSSSINRFKEHPHVKKYFDTSKINFTDKEPNKIHRIITQYFRSLIPQGKEYYLHSFSIQ